MDVFTLLGPAVDLFLVIHALFPPLLALLGLSIIYMLAGEGGTAARLGRLSAYIFAVSYIMDETIVGTVPGLLIRGAAALSSGEQAVISDAINCIHQDPLLGDGPSVLFLTATLSWPLAVILAGFALRQAGKPFVSCVLPGLSSIFTLHASPLGPLGMLFFLLAALRIERAGQLVAAGPDAGLETAAFS